MQEDAFSEMRKIREESSNGREVRAKMADLNKKMNEEVMKLLTAEQKAKWKELTGKPFKGKLEFPPAGRRQG
jgi:hypothetical protein